MIYNFWCLDCNQMFARETPEKELVLIRYQDLEFEGIDCPFCFGKAKMIGKQSAMIVTGKTFAPVAVMEDKDGKQYEINNKGKILNQRKYENDQRGWKRAGKKIREKDQYDKLNNR